MVASTAINSGLGMVFWVVAARVSDSHDVGLAAAAASAMTLLMGFGQLGLPSALPRLLPLAGTGARRLVSGAYRAAVAASLAAALLFVSIAFPISIVRELFAGAPWFTVWFVVSLPLCSLFSIQDFVLCGMRHATWTPAENLVASLGRLVLIPVLSGFGARGLYVATTAPIVAVAVAYSALIFSRVLPVRNSRRGTYDPVEVRRLITSDFAGNLAVTFAGRALPLLIVAVRGEIDGALFYAAWTVAYAVEVVLANIVTTLTVSGAEDENRLRERVRPRIGIAAGAVVALVLVVVAVAHPVLRVFSPEYADAAPALQLLAIALVPRAVTIVGVAIARLERRASAVFAIQVTSATLTVLAAFVGVQVGGITGVAAGYAAAATLTAMIGVRLLRRWLTPAVALPGVVAT
jgi:O-antigen/teichoic acid export membrane protein